MPPVAFDPKKPPIWDMDTAISDFQELASYASKTPDVFACINEVAKAGGVHFVCETDWAATERAGRLVSVYKLCDPLLALLAALRASEIEPEDIERGAGARGIGTIDHDGKPRSATWDEASQSYAENGMSSQNV